MIFDYAPEASSAPVFIRPKNNDMAENVVIVDNRGEVAARLTYTNYEEFQGKDGTDIVRLHPVSSEPEEWTKKDSIRFEELVRRKASIRGVLPGPLLSEFNALQRKRRSVCYPISGEQIVFNQREREAKLKLRALIEEYIELF